METRILPVVGGFLQDPKRIAEPEDEQIGDGEIHEEQVGDGIHLSAPHDDETNKQVAQHTHQGEESVENVSSVENFLWDLCAGRGW